MYDDPGSDQPDNGREIFVHYDVNGQQLKAKGHPDDVNPHVALYASIIAPELKHGVFQFKLPEGVHENAPLLADNGASDQKITKSNGNIPTTSVLETPDFCQFYRNKAPKNQPEQFAVITYYRQKYEGWEGVSASDADNAANSLRRIRAKQFSNPNEAANKAEKKGWLYRLNDETGKLRFALTDLGEEIVENMGQDEGE